MPYRIAEWRGYACLTQQELADRVGVNRVTVARWESGTVCPRLPKIVRKVARVVGAASVQDLRRAPKG